MRELQEIRRQQTRGQTPSFTVDLVEDNLYEWHVRLYQVDPESPLWHDMQESGVSCVQLSVSFPENFPFAPPVPILMQVTASLSKGQARIATKPGKQFNRKLAESSFRSLVKTHDKYGWVTPPVGRRLSWKSVPQPGARPCTGLQVDDDGCYSDIANKKLFPFSFFFFHPVISGHSSGVPRLHFALL
ncbi:hypothetical protein MRX96_031011 [Rhipicephalus microplus]